MNTTTSIAIAALTCAAVSSIASAGVIFSDNFESGLGLWTGKNGGPHSGILVNDPLGSSNTVLKFSQLIYAGDMFTVDALTLDPNETYRLSFDYLGLNNEFGQNNNDTGGYVGFSVDMPGSHSWHWATGSVSGASDVLIDDGQWNSYAFDFTVADLGIGNTVRLMLEDFSGSGGGSGDALFDNFQIATTPVPAPGAIALLGLGGLLTTKRRRS
ncbi:MAG: PEP-CTERM sorting domain-containing protein [Phycisphaerales bacterium]|nr:PEP-CTERM sorting domain-containing protein [Phycisphaerales bacterium]